MLNNSLIINCDGGSRGNPGPAASAFVVTDACGNLVHQQGSFLGDTTNNQAEYRAVITALEWLSHLLPLPASVQFVLDSELVVKQIMGVYKVKEPGMQQLHRLVHQYLNQLAAIKISFSNVLRDQNAAADALVNQTLDSHTSSAR